MTYDEYLALEESSEVRHEFLDGRMRALPDGTLESASLRTSVLSLLVPQLRKRCIVYTFVRVRTDSGLATYPGVAATCGPSIRHEDNDAITNPELIVEVLRPGTEEYNRGERFEHYKTCASLREYVLVAQSERAVEVWTRDNDNRWTLTVVHDGEVAELAIGARLDVRELYEAAAEPKA
jgi:Uma2 family endonuclease